MHRSAERMAAGLLALGIAPGDRVVVQLPNRAAFLETIFGLFRMGALPVFALPAHREAELRHFCHQSDAVALIVPDRHEGFDHRDLAGRVAKAPGPAPRHVLV
ncbi:AMP-binding protein, partial [Streptomyces calidiresistens]|uniref:AMP-binding protein n=1 Tax=Streptomyces calidiresistens TaxID=1485586 RepID=UPI003F691EC6